MDDETYEALKRIMYRTIWIETNALKKDVYTVMDWIDEVAKEHKKDNDN